MPEIGPCGPVGPDAPLSDVEKKEFTKRMAVEGFTAAAVQAACECAFNEGIPVLFLPAGRYAFDKEVPVLGGLTVPGEGSGTVCQTEGKSTHLFRADRHTDRHKVRFTRLKLQGAGTTMSTDNNTYGTFVVEANILEKLRHGVGIRDGSGIIRGYNSESRRCYREYHTQRRI